MSRYGEPGIGRRIALITRILDTGPKVTFPFRIICGMSETEQKVCFRICYADRTGILFHILSLSGIWNYIKVRRQRTHADKYVNGKRSGRSLAEPGQKCVNGKTSYTALTLRLRHIKLFVTPYITNLIYAESIRRRSSIWGS